MSIAKVCKFQKERKEISYDCGETFEPTSITRKIEGREPVERNSTDCGFQISRLTVESGYTCNGYDKYTQLVDKVSYDGELTWEVISGSSRLGTMVERWSSDCCQLRTVSATVCTELFRKANVDIEEASLDGEHWVRTGRYTVNEYLDEYNIDCMNEYGLKFLGLPTSGATGESYFDYEMYTTSASSSAITAVGAHENYVLIGCDSPSNTFICADDGGYEATSGATNNIRYILINDCAVNPTISKIVGEPASSQYLEAKYNYDSLEKIFISSGVSGSFGNIQGLVQTSNNNWKWENVSGSTALTEIVGLENSKITQIGLHMFDDCTSLTYVHTPPVCYFIDGYAFNGCTSLTSVTIDSKNLVDAYSPNYNGLVSQFAGCTSLETVTFPNDYYGLIYAGMFGGCESLTAVTLGNPSAIRNSAFYGCTSLSSITLGNSVTTIGDSAFAYCSNLKDVYIGQTENILANVRSTSFPSGVTIHVPCEAYGYWHQAYEIDHPELGVTIAISGSSGCAETQWVQSGTTCVGYDKYSQYVEQISYDSGTTWYDTGNVSAVTLIEADSIDCGYIPQEYKFLAVEPNESHVVACSSSSALTSGETEPIDSGITVSYSGYVGTCSTNLGFGAFYSMGDNFNNLTYCSISNTVTSIGNYAFRYCRGLTALTIPDSVTYIGDYAFGSCSGLTAINIPSGLTTITSGMCQYCIGLSSVTIPSSVTTIQAYAFEQCTNLSSVTIPSSVTYLGREAFWGCSGLTAITMGGAPPGLYNPSDTDVFTYTNDCPIYVPCEQYDAYMSANGWTKYTSRIQPIDTNCRETRWIESGYTCDGCDKTPIEVEQVRYGSGGTWTNTGNQRTGQVEHDSTSCGCGMKFNFIYSGGTSHSGTCNSSTLSSSEVEYPDYMAKYSIVSAEINGDCVKTIGSSCFYGAKMLSSVTMSEGITIIDSSSFAYCSGSSFTTVDIPSTVTSIGSNAFLHCKSMSTVICRAVTPPTLGNYSVFSDQASGRKIYVPAQSVDAYKSNGKWSTWSSSIEAIPNS